MIRCGLCGKPSPHLSSAVKVCGECLRLRPREALNIVKSSGVREGFRVDVGLPANPPKREGGFRCGLCVNECSVPREEGASGFCGAWVVRGGRLTPVAGWGRAVVEWYFDPHPTNCVAAHFCPAVTGAGFPEFAVRPGLEEGYVNLAVFFAGCSLDCVFCQNWQHKVMAGEAVSKGGRVPWVRGWEELVDVAMNPRVTCICYFGGDPGPHAPFALRVSREVTRAAREHGLVKRVCWETNGVEHPGLMRAMAKLSLLSGGIVKIDWKAWTPSIYEALTGVNGEKTVKRLMINTALVARMGRERPEIPLLTVSVLMVPGYVGAEEVRKISEYLASLDTDIPLVLLAFHPDHLMNDVGTTPRKQAEECVREARNAGLKHVYVGNVWLLQ